MSDIRFDHIAIAVRRIADAPAFLVGELGGTPHAGRSTGGAFIWGAWRFEGGGKLEILEPHGPDGFLHRFLARHGPGIHHVTFKVPSLAEACERARARGYSIVGYDDSDPSWKEAFLHPKEALGIVVQFAEAHRPPDGAPVRAWPPLGPPDPLPPVTVLGLRLRARSPERARRQWAEVVGGEETAGADGTLIYRWPRAPMRIAVEIDPASPEGPVGIELMSRRPLDLPKGPHPVLGAVFLQVEPSAPRLSTSGPRPAGGPGA
jgi:methylmalonyl-CoA/ethylmalonyl-CoA epimerase